MEVEREYNAVRRTALLVKHDLNSLETVIGKHAAHLVDYANEEDGAEGRVQRMATVWASVLLSGDCGKGDTQDCRFRQMVHKMVGDFTDGALRAVRGEVLHLECDDAIRVFQYLSVKGARNFNRTVEQLQHYMACLHRLSAARGNPVYFKQVATVCILTGLQLGAYLDSII